MGLKFNIQSSALPSNATVIAFRGSEGISRPYVFDIYVNVIGDELTLDDAPGSSVVLSIAHDSGVPNTFRGIIAQIELLRAVQQQNGAGFGSPLQAVASAFLGGDNALYLVRLVPSLWQLSLTKHSRIFTNVSVKDVVSQVLEDEGIDNVEFRLTKTYEPEEHITQYKESSLNFIHRWMEREGLYYFFDQSGDKEKLVITDDKGTAEASRAAPIVYQAGGAGAGAGAHFDMFRTRHCALPSTVRYTDYDYCMPQLDVSAQAAVSPIGTGDVVTYGYRFFTPSKGASLAAIRADDFRAQAKTFHASGPVTDTASGYKFTLDLHPQALLNTEYLAVAVEHFGYLNDAAQSWGKLIPAEYTDVYRVDVTAIVADQQYRHPELAPWPRIDGYENALVDGPATSDYAQIDEHGRYAVKFKFDEGSLKDGKASTFVRKGQPHAGTVEGFHFPERKGTEVICAFMSGDPDRPVIVAAVTTTLQQSPVKASNFTKNVIQTGGLNRFEMEDLAGKQRVTMSTPTAATHILMGDPVGGHHLIAKTTGNSHQYSDGYHDAYHGGHHHEHVMADLKQEVEAAVVHLFNATLNQTVQAAVTHTFNSTQTKTVVGDVVASYLSSHIESIAADVQHKIGANLTQKIGANLKKDIGANMESTIGGNEKRDVGGTENKSVLGDAIHNFGASVNTFIQGDWITNIEAAKSETVAGIKFETTLGAAFDNVIGARIDSTVGIEINLAAAVHMSFTPSKLDIELEKNSLHAVKDEIAPMKNELHAMNEKISGLHTATVALHNIESGVYNHGHGLHVMEGGLATYNHALEMHE